MNSGKFRHLIEIWGEADKVIKGVDGKPDTIAKNSIGEPIKEEQKLDSVFASFESKSGSMLYGRPADTKLSKTTHKITYRYLNYPDLSDKNFIMFKGKRYEIDYVDNKDEMDEIMEVFVTKEG